MSALPIRSTFANLSGPILTTVTDICGFFFTLGLAALALSNGCL